MLPKTRVETENVESIFDKWISHQRNDRSSFAYFVSTLYNFLSKADTIEAGYYTL